MIRYVCVVISIFALGCSVLNLKRDVASSVQKNEEAQKIEAGQKTPWLFTNANRYCDQKMYYTNKYDQNISDHILNDRNIQTDVQNLIDFSNHRFFSEFGCDNRYKKILTDMLKEASQPTFDLNQCEGQSCFVSQKYEGFYYQNKSTAVMKNLIDRPVYQNEQMKIQKNFDFYNLDIENNMSLDKFFDPKKSITVSEAEEPAATDISVSKYENLEMQTEPYTNSVCVTTIRNKINNNVIDYFLAHCNERAKIEPIFVSVNGRTEIIYTDFDSSLNKFVIMSHPLQNLSGQQIDEKVNQGDANINTDIQVLALDHFVEDVSKEIVIAFPRQMQILAFANGYILTLNTLFGLSSDIHIYALNKNFRDIQSKGIVTVESSRVNIGELTSDGFLISSQTGDQLLTQQYQFETSKVVEIDRTVTYIKNKNTFIQKLIKVKDKSGRFLPVTMFMSKGYLKNNFKNFGFVNVYGGFDLPIVANLSASEKYILNHGGFVAYASIPGDANFGPHMHEEVKGVRYIDRVDAYLKVVNYLIDSKYAPQGRIVASGGSNGGLMVLLAAAKSPKSFAAVLATSPVADVINLNKSEILAISEHWQKSDYGLLSDPEVQEFWKKYSPVQNVKNNKILPRILLRTAIGDPNVNPSHSFKMFKELMNNYSQSRKFQMFVQPNGEGHYPKDYRAEIEERSYQLSFVFKILGIDP